MSKSCLKVIAACVIYVNAYAAFSQVVATARFAEVVVNLPIPRGYCVIPREDELGALHYKLQEDGNRGRNRVAILFSDCQEWAQRKENPALLLQNHGNYLFQLTGGEERLLPVTTTRADVVKIYVDHELKSSGAKKDLAAHLNEKLARSNTNAPTLQNNINHGLIDRDELAAYMGIGATLDYEGTLVRFIGVTGATTTRRVPTTINLYGPVATGSPFGKLLSQQKAMVRQLITANE